MLLRPTDGRATTRCHARRLNAAHDGLPHDGSIPCAVAQRCARRTASGHHARRLHVSLDPHHDCSCPPSRSTSPQSPDTLRTEPYGTYSQAACSPLRARARHSLSSVQTQYIAQCPFVAILTLTSPLRQLPSVHLSRELHRRPFAPYCAFRGRIAFLLATTRHMIPRPTRLQIAHLLISLLRIIRDSRAFCVV
ncbi:hypothetical protein BKA62DRAFT_107380 [Auriculariales sp. MPI-PUGE-AT-0066]|nr:hypothetical protein BKA62DRAFT_107380 [Auriculariales sp. MPI-PUGE-AT-0066]